MARLLTIREICERALRKIGSFSMADTGADPAEMEETVLWLDMIVSHLASSTRAWWLVPATASITLTAGETSLNLAQAVGTSQAPYGVQFPISATILRSTSVYEEPIKIFKRFEWDAIEDKTETGAPEAIFIDRLRDPTLFWNPLVAADDTTTYTLKLTFQSFTQDLTAANLESKATQLHNAWNLYLVAALAAEVGDGPVRKLPQGEVDRMRVQVRKLEDELLSFEALQHADEPRQVAYNDF